MRLPLCVCEREREREYNLCGHDFAFIIINFNCDRCQFAASHTFKLQGCKQTLATWTHFAASTTGCALPNTSGIVARSVFSRLADSISRYQPIRNELHVFILSQMTLSLSDELDKFTFIEILHSPIRMDLGRTTTAGTQNTRATSPLPVKRAMTSQASLFL